jgi:outer membrane protein assembly factor BamB
MAKTIMRGLVVGVMILSGFAAWGQVNVLTQHNDLARTGANLHETILTPADVNAKRFGMIFKRVLDDQVYGQPLLATNVKIGGGTHDVVYLTTVNNSVYAFDANDPAATAPIWHVNFGTPPNLYSAKFGCFDMNGKIGIVGTPVIDLASGTLYVVALTEAGGGFEQRLHALDISTGADLANSPATIAAPEFDPLMENQRPALLLANGTVYVGYASHCDKEPYHGFLLGYDAKTLRQTAVFNTSPTGSGASIWQSGQAPAADARGDIYVVAGNGSWDGKANFSESFLKLDPKLKLLDWFTPTDHLDLDAKDTDVNSSGATLIPGANLVVGGGKSGVLYTLNTAHFGHLGDQNAVQRFQATSSHLHSIVYWESAKRGKLLYIWGQRDRLRAYKFDGDKLDEQPFMGRPEMNQGHPGGMLSLSANGGEDGILWAAIHATGDSWHESRPGILHAYDADDLDRELWNSLEIPARDDCGNYAKMAPPTVANGKVYLPSFGTENVGAGQFCVYGLLPQGPAPAAPAQVKAVAEDGRVTLSWQAAGAGTTYRVASAASVGGPFEMLAVGLTSPHFNGIAAPEGTSYYTVTAVNSNGVSAPSAPASVTLAKPEAMPRTMVMH